MSAYEDFRRRMLVQGSDEVDALINSTSEVFNDTFANSSTYYNVAVNGKQIGMRVLSDTEPNKRKILFQNGDVAHGDIVEFDGLKWLVVDYPFDNRIYLKSAMVVCNEVIAVEEETDDTIVGYDNLGRPIYDITTSTIEFPCVVQNIAEYNADSNNQPINMTEAETTIMMQYTNNPLIKLGLQFELYGSNHMVIGVDKRNIINGKGCITLVTQKT
jgi:hypothetical protein